MGACLKRKLRVQLGENSGGGDWSKADKALT